MPGKKLGTILMEKGWLQQNQLTQALQHQQFFGGRLGSCLLELNLITENRLLDALSQQFRVDPIGLDDLRNIPKSALELIPSRMAGKSKVIAFELYGTEASVAMMSPNDLMLQDELAFVVGRRLKIRVAPEVRILEALEKYHGWDVDSRFSRIWDRLNRARYLWQEEQSAPAPSVAPTPSSTFEIAPPPHLETKPSEEALQTPPAASPAMPPPPPMPPEPVRAAETPPPPAVEVAEIPKTSLETPGTLAELEAAMDGVGERDDIATLVLRYLLQDFTRVLLFMVRGGEIAGWMGQGEDVEQTMINNFEMGFDEPSLFLNLREGSPFYRGPLPKMDAHQQLSRVWGGGFPREIVLLPVRLRERLVTVIYCDRGSEGLGALDLNPLQRVAQLTGLAFEQFIVRKKKQHH